MKHALAMALAGALTLGAAEANDFAKTCARGGDVRMIEVLKPGEIGGACDMKYIRDNGNHVSTPYHADNSPEFCGEKARELVESLTTAGYACVDAAPPPLREADAGAEATDPAPESVADAPPQAPVTPSEVLVAEAPSPAPVPETAPAAEPPAFLEQPSASAPVGEVAGEAADGFGPVANAAASRPAGAPAEAVRGPLALSTAEPALSSSPARVSSSVRGRIVGAEPDAQPVSGAATPVTTVAAVAAPGLRSPEALIQTVLAAQTAAWNEGDLDAFMTGYWNSPDLRFVSGAKVTKGWRQARDRYRDAYGASLGRLSLEGLDVQMVSDDVAVVVGRFRLARDEAQDTGAFTLVMKRFDGLWRIVHDHSVGDSAASE